MRKIDTPSGQRTEKRVREQEGPTPTNKRRESPPGRVHAHEGPALSSPVASRPEMTTKPKFAPLFAQQIRAHGQVIATQHEITKLTRSEGKKSLPCVFVVQKNEATSGGPAVVLGADFLDLLYQNKPEAGPLDASFVEQIQQVEDIIVLLPKGDHQSVHIPTVLADDPSASALRSLLDINTSAAGHRFDDAEIRVRVASALHRKTFGFHDPELAASILAPLEKDALAVGIQRIFFEGVERGHTELVALMLDWGANINQPAEDDPLTALALAQRLELPEMAKFLLKKGAASPQPQTR